ncbi:MAG TPA: secretin N-terminal domain-containing protein [Steroidobacteraceae bacterium]
MVGLVAVANEGVVRVVPNTDVRQMALPVVTPENVKGLDDEWVICVAPLKGIGAAQLVPILRPLLPSYGHLAALPDRNALLIVDRSANVRRLVEIIKTFENLPKAVELPASKSQ